MLKNLFLICAIIIVSTSAVFAQGGSTPGPSPTPATVSKPKRPPIFTANKSQVMQAQKLLKSNKMYSGEETGKRDPVLKAAIKVYQKTNGLRATGTLNRATLEKMGIELTEKQKLIPVTASSLTPTAERKPRTPKTKTSSTSSTTNASDGTKRPAPFRATKDQITALQKVLKDAKLFAGEANGIRSDALKEAVRNYQAANGLKATGGINAATLEKMGIALTDSQKASQSH